MNNKQTVLHIAASKDHSVICSILLENGVDFDALDDNLDNGMIISSASILLFFSDPKVEPFKPVYSFKVPLKTYQFEICFQYFLACQKK